MLPNLMMKTLINKMLRMKTMMSNTRESPVKTIQFPTIKREAENWVRRKINNKRNLSHQDSNKINIQQEEEIEQEINKTHKIQMIKKLTSLRKINKKR